MLWRPTTDGQTGLVGRGAWGALRPAQREVQLVLFTFFQVFSTFVKIRKKRLLVEFSVGDLANERIMLENALREEKRSKEVYMTNLCTVMSSLTILGARHELLDFRAFGQLGIMMLARKALSSVRVFQVGGLVLWDEGPKVAGGSFGMTQVISIGGLDFEVVLRPKHKPSTWITRSVEMVDLKMASTSSTHRRVHRRHGVCRQLDFDCGLEAASKPTSNLPGGWDRVCNNPSNAGYFC